MLPRHATEAVVKRLATFRVVVVTGARQVGKSTLARLVLDRLGGDYLTLDDPLTLSQATSDPDGLVANARGLTVVDEVQRAPDLLRAVKLLVDRDPAPGRFLLTGSANLLAMRTVTESLAGRAAFPDHHSFSAAELARLIARAAALAAVLVTTAKDAARLAPADRARVSVIGVQLAWHDEAAWQTLLAGFG